METILLKDKVDWPWFLKMENGWEKVNRSDSMQGAAQGTPRGAAAWGEEGRRKVVLNLLGRAPESPAPTPQAPVRKVSSEKWTENICHGKKSTMSKAGKQKMNTKAVI